MTEGLREKRTGEAGITLIELIVVLVILGMIAAVVAPNAFKRMGESRVHIAKIQISEFEASMQLYLFDMRRPPTTAEGLQALIQNPTGSDSWQGPYLNKRELPNDPWGKPYTYKSPGEHGDFEICSAGPDGTDGTDDDVCNWQ